MTDPQGAGRCMKAGQEHKWTDSVVTSRKDLGPVQWQECKRCGRHRHRPESLLDDPRYQKHFAHFLDLLDS